MLHSESESTSIQVVSTAPTDPPTEAESNVRVQFYLNGVVIWVWNSVAEQWEGTNGRPARDADNPTGVVTPLFVGQEYFSYGDSRMYYANGATSADWITYGY